MRCVRLTASVLAMTMLGLCAVGAVSAQEKVPAVSDAWVQAPAAGATSAVAFATVENPTMYDFYVVSVAADAAGKVELRQGGTAASAVVKEVTVPAYGSLYMDAKGVHVMLSDLKKPLNEGDKVTLTLTTELGVKLEVAATVKK